MSNGKNHNKIYTVLVLCIGIIVSVYLLQKNTGVKALTNTNTTSVEVGQISNNNTTNDDWKKILVNVDPKNVNSTSVLTSDNSNVFDELTLTAQLARDLFSRYLLIAKKDGGVTPDDADQIAGEVLSSPEYTKPTGVLYNETNLHINKSGDPAVLKKYGDALNEILKSRIAAIKSKEGPVTILDTALTTEDENKIKELDSIVTASRGVVSDLIQMEVPLDFVPMHIQLLNSSSNILSNLEGMRQTFADPVKSFVAANQYPKNMSDFLTALSNINTYYKQKLGL